MATNDNSSLEVIDITSCSNEPPSSEKNNINNNSSDGKNNNSSNVRIKQDPGGATKKIMTKGNSQDEEEDDSEIEILTPSRFPKRNSSGSNNINNNNNNNSGSSNNMGMGGGGGVQDDDDDDIQITSSNTTNPNIDHPHARFHCGVHPFTLPPSNVVDDDNNNTLSSNVNYCEKCYCFICDKLASECTSWDMDSKSHCHAHDKNETYVQLREETLKARGVDTKKSASLDGEVTLLNPPRNPYHHRQQQQQQQQSASSGGMMMQQMMTGLIHNEFLSRLASNNDTSETRVAEEQRRQITKQKKDMRITEVLMENFKKIVSLAEGNAASVEDGRSANSNNRALDAKENQTPSSTTVSSQQQRMDGDIPTISLQNTFFVEGVKIGWPFPEIMKPQRLMAVHLIKALKNKKHVVLESPTGTGKSAALLCSVLAWQRYHYKMEQSKNRTSSDDIIMIDGEEDSTKVPRVKIIYCSRTHSQVAQMVASLKSTPYRPRMAILGSRDRLCIHKSIKPRGHGAEPVKGVNVNNECRLRVRNTEKSRKHMLTNPGNNNDIYLDDDPPEHMPGDGGTEEQDGMTNDGPTEGGDNDGFMRRRRTCPHYRQLTTSRVANLAHSTFVPSKKVNCCSLGGKKSKHGAHDIEDLVNFGVDPYVQKDVALYRRDPNESFGLSLKGGTGSNSGSFVREVKNNTPADIDGSIKPGDKILRVNGANVSNASPSLVVEKIKSAKSDPLMLDVSRSGSISNGDGGYSSRAACPYYLSQVLSKDADIIFAPYNYVLDPGIRDALGIELGNSVVILDEAHNVESTLREAGSGKFGEFELCELIVMLNNYAITERSTSNMIDVAGAAGVLSDESESAYLCDVAHTLLMFVEKIVSKLRTAKTCFEKNPGKKGAAMALKEWEKYHTADDSEFEVTFDGPTGKGTNGKCVGCMPFFDRLGLTKDDFDGLCTYIDSFDKFIRGHESNEGSERDRVSNLLDRLMELIHKLNMAIQTPEHYYAAVLATANGSLDYANGGDGEQESGGGRRPKKKPRDLPLIPPRTKENPNRVANPCTNPICRAKCTDAFNPIRHGDCCNGSRPKWECILHLDLLTPGPLMQDLSSQCRTVVLASGSLSPIPSLCAELNLFPEDGPLTPVKSTSNSTSKIQKRLQTKPSPLEADHVVDLEKQLCAVSIGHFPDGSELRVAQKNYKQPDFLPKLGDALVRIVAGIPEGGVLVFLPSYALLRKCERVWNPNGFRQNNRRSFWAQDDDIDSGPSVWDRLKELKHNVVVEPSGNQDEFEQKKQEYMDSVKNMGGCVLLAVYRGKMSEGISFNDNNARGVICIGLPLPSAFALPVKVKMDYNDEQRKLRNRTDLLPGREWYNQQAYRAIAQALGRCIRHAADYGAIFLLDIRHCDDGSPNGGIPQAHKNLPKWMRRCVRNLSKRSTGGRNSMFGYTSSSTGEILGGWSGLKPEMKRFFKNAKPHANEVLKRQREKMAKASSKSNAVSTEENRSVPPTLSESRSSPSESNDASTNSISSTTPMQTCPPSTSKVKAASASNSNMFVIDRQPATTSKPKHRAQSSSSKKKGTLQEMFKKQQGGSSQKRAAASSSTTSKSAKKANKGTLHNMFEKQRAAASATQEMIDVDEEENEKEEEEENEEEEETTSNSNGNVSSAQASNSAPPANSFSFKRSPFVDDMMLTPATEVADSASQLAINQSQPASASPMEEEEHLCVVCEDGKKGVLLIPCKHMCLCRECANRCLFKTIKDCPMCRTKIEDSVEVYW